MILGKLNIPKVSGGSTPITRIYAAEWLSGGKLFYTDDFGANWTEGFSPSSGMILSMAVRSDGLGVFGNNSASYVPQYYSTDYGATGIAISPAANWRYAGVGAWISRTDDILLNVGSRFQNPDIRISFDGGSNWSTKHINQYDPGVVRGNDDGSMLFLANMYRNPGIWKSTDYATSWTQIRSGERTYPFVTSDTCQYMAYGVYPDYQKLYVSNDYGVTWTLHTLSPTPTGHLALGMDKTGQFITVFGDVDQFYCSTNYGVSFTKKTPPFTLSIKTVDYVNPVMDRNGTVSVVKGYGVNEAYYTLDLGDTWNTLPLPNANNFRNLYAVSL